MGSDQSCCLNCHHKYIRKEINDEIAVITLDRPPLNILSSEVYEELKNVLEEVEQEKDVRVVIITGAGEKAFCAGADISEFAKLDKVTGTFYTARNQAIRKQVFNFPRPVIAAINGHALGGGCAIALACDFRIASEKASFGLGEINMGIIGGVPLAIRMLPPAVAKYLIYTGERISAQQAQRFGLADKVLAPSEVMPAAYALAKKIAAKSPLAIAYAKKIMNSCYSETLEQSMAAEVECLRTLWGTTDKDEGVRAFLEKRAPVFKGC